MGHNFNLTIILFTCCLPFCNSQAQVSSKKGVELINELILSDSISVAERELSEQIEQLKSRKNYDSLIHYVLPLGRVEISSKNTLQLAKTLAEEIKQNKTGIAIQSKLNIELSKLYFEIGELDAAFKLAEEAKMLALEVSDDDLLINSEYYLGDYALRTGNIEVLETNIRRANRRLEDKKGLPHSITAHVLNLMGAVMFFSSKQDSAQYYFESALKFIPNLEDNIENKYYLPASIKGNLFLIKLNNGQYTEASTLAEESLRLNHAFLLEAPNHHLAARVKKNLAIGYVNLSSLNFDLGDFERADDIMKLGYSFAQNYLKPNTREYFLTLLGIAEVKIAKQEPEKSLDFLLKAESCLAQMNAENDQLSAYLYTNYGEAYHRMDNNEKALEYYKKSASFYKKVNGDSYDSNRLYQIMNMGLISAELGEKDEAIATVEKAYNYIVKENGADTYFANILALTLAKINFQLKEYSEALKWSNLSLGIYKKNGLENTDDKLYFEEKKAEVILLNVKAKYHLEKKRNPSFLKDLISEINEAIKILENRKSVISSTESVTILLEDNKDVFDFTKKLNLELFDRTKDLQFLNKAVSLHESALYNRIRVRLNINNAISFSDIPNNILVRENRLRDELSIDTEYENAEALTNLLQAKTNWTAFLDTLKQSYPKYYKMRYETIGESLETIQKNIPKNTTAIRYFFIDDTLYAYLVSSETEKLILLESSEIEKYVSVLGENQSDINITGNALNELYKKLWQPFEDQIRTTNIIVVPDGILYNLSFESLTPTKIESYKEMATKSLLAKYTISYNYSLYLLNTLKKSKVYEQSFVAFAPEFNDAMKTNYIMAVSDSLQLDKSYLKLLQQPFNVNLAKSYGTLFDGNYFINENSTEQIFKNNAGEHKIIHIGTHAESNNISPELSRLIFAKDVFDINSTEDNSFYTYEIYNTSLNSNLAILTACETGKPSYQPGEGMISLAHAFNYAGSESILTTLWQVDERSSAEIIELFYGYIKSGKPKDEALRLAKLGYLKNTDGRTLAPQYWAGLVLMGDTAPINISDSTNWMYLIFGIVALVLLGIFLKNRLRTS